MMISYDKALPGAARELAADGVSIGVRRSDRPASRLRPSADLSRDRWARRFGDLRFVADADLGGDVLATAGAGSGSVPGAAWR